MTIRPGLRRLLAVALLALLAAGVHATVTGPLLELYGGDRDRIAASQMAIPRYQQIGQRLQRLERQLAELRSNPAGEAGYLEGDDEAMTGAALQLRLKQLLQREGGQLKSTQMLSGRDEGEVRRVALRGQIVTSAGVLQRVLYDLEAGSPYLFIDNLELRPAASADGGEPALDARFELYGFMRGRS